MEHEDDIFGEDEDREEPSAEEMEEWEERQRRRLQERNEY